MNKENKPKILLLGGEGFIGRNLANYLAKSFECLSVGAVRSLFLAREDTFIASDPYADTLAYETDVVIHLIDNKRCQGEEFLNEEKKLVENIALNKSKHLVLFSSAVVYANPDSEYGVRKQQLETFYTEYCQENNVPLTIVRLFNTFGAFQLPYRQGSLVANLIYNHLNAIPTEIQDLSAQRDFLYAGDIPKFIELFIKEKITGTYDLGSGKLTSLEEVVTMLQEQTEGEPLNIINKNIPELFATQSANNQFLDTIALTPMPESLRETINFFSNNRAILQTYVAKK